MRALLNVQLGHEGIVEVENRALGHSVLQQCLSRAKLAWRQKSIISLMKNIIYASCETHDLITSKVNGQKSVAISPILHFVGDPLKNK